MPLADVLSQSEVSIGQFFQWDILAREKYNQLKLLFRYTEVRIGCFAGGNKPRGGVEAYDVLICTIEKANFILNYLKTEEKLGKRLYHHAIKLHSVYTNGFWTNSIEIEISYLYNIDS